MNVLSVVKTFAALMTVLVSFKGLAAAAQGELFGCLALLLSQSVLFYLARSYKNSSINALVIVAVTCLVHVVVAPSIILPVAANSAALSTQAVVLFTFIVSVLNCAWHADWACKEILGKRFSS